MTPLFELPKNILKENLSEYKTLFNFILTETKKLDDVVVTKNFDGSPNSHFGDEEWDFRAYLDARIVYKNALFSQK